MHMHMRLRRSGRIAGPQSARRARLPWHLRKVRLRRKDGISHEDEPRHRHRCVPSLGERGRLRRQHLRRRHEDNSTVAVVWDGRGTTTAGTTYHNTYAWFMTLSGGKVIDGTAFDDSIAFNELWDGVTP
jgi:ketosteroid isomerase-like protein